MFLKKNEAGTIKTIQGAGPVESVVPKQFDIQSKLAFGFEIGRPAYPADDEGRKKMLLTNEQLDQILVKNANKFDGMIMWEVNKPIWSEAGVNNQASVKDVLQKTCTKFNLDKGGYNCNADFPVTKLEPIPTPEPTPAPEPTPTPGSINISGNFDKTCTLACDIMSLNTNNIADDSEGHVSFVGKVGTCNLSCDVELTTIA
ncbi:hypothetical protein NOVO_02260 [Rickettsiales bacterium Ac37b]|nr:hypothetical protein NOVO_02260 [Rickettsiales bacterium Ac37b]